MGKPKKIILKLGSTGDTLVEILLAIMIVSSVLAGAFVSVTQSLREASLSQERSEALGEAGAQLENVRALSREPNTEVFDTTQPLFCIVNDEIKRFSHTSVPALESDNFTSYPIDCQNHRARYNMSIYYDSAQSLFVSRARWDGPTHSRQEVVLSYRIHLNTGSSTPAPPPPPPGPVCPLASAVTVNFPGYPGDPSVPSGIYDDQNPFRLSHNPASLAYMPSGYPNVTGPIGVPAIPAYNNYTVEFGLYDQHHAAATPQQDNYEQMKVKLYDGGGNPIYTSPDSPDLPEAQVQLIVTYIGQNIPAGSVNLRAHHTWDNWPGATPDPTFPHRGNSFNPMYVTIRCP